MPTVMMSLRALEERRRPIATRKILTVAALRKRRTIAAPNEILKEEAISIYKQFQTRGRCQPPSVTSSARGVDTNGPTMQRMGTFKQDNGKNSRLQIHAPMRSRPTKGSLRGHDEVMEISKKRVHADDMHLSKCSIKSKRFSASQKIIYTVVFVIAVALGLYQFFRNSFTPSSHVNDSFLQKPGELMKMTELQQDLETNVFGQDIAMNIFTSTLMHFLASSKRSVVYSFHGWIGVGKSHCAQIISKHFATVLHFIASVDFNPLKSPVVIYQYLMSHVKFSCHSSTTLVIIDEMESANQDTVTAITAFLSHMKSGPMDLECVPKVVFILISTSKGLEINSHYMELQQNNIPRYSMDAYNFQKILQDVKEIEWYFGMLHGELFDELIPFLPLDKNHIEKCVTMTITKEKLNAPMNFVSKVSRQIQFYGNGETMISKSGCKGIAANVHLLLEHEL